MAQWRPPFPWWRRPRPSTWPSQTPYPSPRSSFVTPTSCGRWYGGGSGGGPGHQMRQTWPSASSTTSCQSGAVWPVLAAWGPRPPVQPAQRRWRQPCTSSWSAPGSARCGRSCWPTSTHTAPPSPRMWSSSSWPSRSVAGRMTSRPPCWPTSALSGRPEVTLGHRLLGP